MIEKIKCFIEFRFLLPIRFAFCILYLELLLYGICRELIPSEYEHNLNEFCIIVYLLWLCVFLIKAFIEVYGYRLINTEKTIIKATISIGQICRIRNRAFDKVLIKIQFDTSQNITYFSKYVCDPLYFDVYIKPRLNKEEQEIEMWKMVSGRYYFNMREIMEKIAYSKADYNDYFLKWTSKSPQITTVVCCFLLLVCFLYIIANIVCYDYSKVICGVIAITIISCVLYVRANK